MIIHEVRLENVKSYGSPAETIRFHRGVNAICGPNGAGKSTILEAIGCALFQHLPYQQAEFVREGETEGTITVVVESQVDQRIYEVVRRIGRRTAYYVYDPDICQQVASGHQDVERWLHQHLRIDEGTDLRTLFLDSVGPPQGTLTAAFLESPQQRRTKFNRLLRVDEYGTAFEKLAALDTALKQEIQNLDVEIARLEALTGDRPQIEAELAAIREQKDELVTQLRRALRDKAAVQEELKRLTEAEERHRAAGANLDLARHRLEDAEKRLAQVAEEQRRAAEAQETCERTRAGYERYCQILDALRALEHEQAERDRLARERHQIELDLEGVRREIQHQERELARLARFAEELAVLERLIPEQEAAEKALERARQARSESAALQKSLPDLEAHCARARQRLAEVAARITAIEELRTIAAALPDRQARYQEIADQLTAVNQAEGRLRTLQDMIRSDQERVARLRQDSATLDRQIAEISALEPKAALAPALEERHRALADELAGARSRLAQARASREQVTGGLCPFLREPCRNLRPGITLEVYFDEEIEHWAGELSRLEDALQVVEGSLAEAKTAEARTALLPDLHNQRVRLDSEIEDAERRLAENRQSLAEVAELAGRRGQIEQAAQEARVLLRESEEAVREVARLPELQADRDAAHADLAATEGQITRVRERLEELAVIAADLPAAVEKLNALRSPRERAAALKRDLEERPAVEEAHEAACAREQRLAARLAEVDRALEPYRGLDERLRELRSERDRCRDDHDAHVAARPLAETLAVWTARREQGEAEVAAAAAAVRDAQTVFAEASRSYDAEAHGRARERGADLERQIGEIEARLESAEKDERRLLGELERVQEIERALMERRRQRERIEEERQLAAALREAIRSAGPEITRQILGRISRIASQINAEILNRAGVELEWTTEYEIITRQNGETRGFAQLSGGEQMAAALAVRLAILRDLSNIRIAFLDEPTAHLDQERRSNLGDQVQRLHGFDQLVVISHDDTFDGLFSHVIRLTRENGRSRVLNEE
ncbi:MAG TPA: SMC family ATPase [Chloroflexota bacterium]|nr:SMC family ATPase [Chloroflexota bacterium]